MCGIAGIFNWGYAFSSDELREITQKMCDSMVHRGPDDGGVWVSNSGLMSLGHRRLSILDLTQNGHQPMSDDKKSCWVTLNGEIYNYKKIKAQLSKLDIHFNSESDTEVLPYLFKDMDANNLQQLDGMYAFAVWNDITQKLFLARDPFGKKPLYYSEGPGWFAFSSELQALKKVPGFDKTINKDAIDLYLLLQYIPAPFSIFNGAKKLPPGSYLQIEAPSTGSPPIINTHRHFNFDPTKNHDEKPGNLSKEELRQKLINSVEKRLISDVPVGAFLSGGVDSSLVAAIATKELGMQLKTFTVGFSGSIESEHEMAREISGHLNTEHYEKILDPDALALAQKVADSLDEPNGDSSCLPTMLLSEHAKKYVTVALSGDGGDELFGGYSRYKDTINQTKSIFQKIKSVVLNGPDTLASTAYLSSRFFIFLPEEIKALRGLRSQNLEHHLAAYKKSIDNPKIPLIHRMRYLDSYTYLPGAVLAKVDRMSMQSSLEVRCPLLDKEVAKFAEKLPAKMCFEGPDKTKPLLKELASDYLPKEWVNRPKLGFGIPSKSWSQENATAIAESSLMATNSPILDFIPKESLKIFLHLQKQKGGFSIYKIWPLLILNFWLQNNYETT